MHAWYLQPADIEVSVVALLRLISLWYSIKINDFENDHILLEGGWNQINQRFFLLDKFFMWDFYLVIITPQVCSFICIEFVWIIWKIIIHLPAPSVSTAFYCFWVSGLVCCFTSYCCYVGLLQNKNQSIDMEILSMNLGTVILILISQTLKVIL